LFGAPVATPWQNPVTPKFGLEYQADDHDLYYLSIAKGYRPGGINFPAPTQCTSIAPLNYDSDSLWSYEIGAKNRLLDNRLQLNTAAFLIDWRDIQTNVFDTTCGNSFNFNAGRAYVKGVELSAQALVTDSLRTDLGVSYTSGKFLNTVVSQGAVLEHRGDQIGTLPQAPAPLSITASVEYDFSVLEHKSYVRAEDIYHSHNGGRFPSQQEDAFFAFNPALVANPSTNMLNFRASTAFGATDIALFVQNALDAHPILGVTNVAVGYTSFVGSTLRPRTIGVNVTTHF
jgi:iron complex outermembrane receptor protein